MRSIPSQAGTSFGSRSALRCQEDNAKSRKSVLILQYHGKISDQLIQKVKKITDEVEVICITRKLKSILPSLKEPVPQMTRSRVVYKVMCTGCNACYVGMTARHFKTRLSEHLKVSAPVGAHLSSCRSIDAYETEILDACHDTDKLSTLEALYIQKLDPQINTREEYATRPLTIKM